MSSNTGAALTAAKVYAEAMFSIAREESKTAEYAGELAMLGKVFKENPELYEVLGSPAIQPSERMQALEGIFKERVSERVYSFLSLLIEKRRVNLLEGIAGAYAGLMDEASGVMEVTATASKPLSAGIKAKLVKALEAKSGKTIRLLEKTDPDILGGIILDFGNAQLDASVKSKLEGIHTSLKGIVA